MNAPSKDTARRTRAVAMRVAKSVLGTGPDAARLVEGACRIARDGMPFALRGGPGAAYDLAAVFPRVEGARHACEGTLRGVLRIASGPRRGDLATFSVDAVTFSEGSRGRIASILEQVALGREPASVRTGFGDPYMRDRGFPTGILPIHEPRLYGARETDAALAASRLLMASALARKSFDGLSLPVDAYVEVRPRPAGGANLVVGVGLRLRHLAGLPADAPLPPSGHLPAGTRMDLPEGTSVDRCIYGEIAFAPIAQAMREDHARRARAVRAWFARRVERRIVRSLTPADVPVEAYNWLRAAPSERAFLDRSQAVEAFPVIATIVPGPDLDAAIDGRRALIPALAERLGTSPAAARALRGLTPREVDLKGLLAELPALARIDPKHLPSAGGARPRGEQWDVLARTTRSWRRLLDAPPGGTREERVVRAMAGEPPNWQRRGFDAPSAVLVGEADDYLSAIARHLVLPVILDLAPPPCPSLSRLLLQVLERQRPGQVETAAYLPFLEGRRLRTVMADAKAWHARVDRIEAALALGPGREGPLTWEPLSAPYAVPGSDLTVVPLTSDADLAAEGSALRHCVASYATKCLFEGAHVLSVRRGGVSLSTVHLDLSGPTTDPYHVIQHKSVRNAKPPEEARQAMLSYLAALRDGVLERNPAAARTIPDAARWRTPGAAEVGYDPSDPAQRDLALGLYAFALPEVSGGMTHAAWVERHGLAGSLLPVVRKTVALAFHDPARRAEIVREAAALPPGRLAEFLANLGLGGVPLGR